MPDFIRRYYESDRPIELRPVELGRYFGQKIDDGRINVWIRTAAKLPDDPALHMCALAYASDFSLLDAAMARYGRTLFDKRMMPASLDHAMWFHRPFRADEWLLYAQDSPSAQGGRGLTRGMIFKPDGTLVASVAQEGSLRQRKSVIIRLSVGVSAALDQFESATRTSVAIPAHHPRNRDDECAGDREHDRPPQHARVRWRLKTISRRVPWTLRQIQRIQAVVTQAQPMMVMKENVAQDLPADERHDAAIERDRQRLAVRAEIARPAIAATVQDRERPATECIRSWMYVVVSAGIDQRVPSATNTHQMVADLAVERRDSAGPAPGARDDQPAIQDACRPTARG